jgi:hypothetical protein
LGLYEMYAIMDSFYVFFNSYDLSSDGQVSMLVIGIVYTSDRQEERACRW